MLDIFRQIRYNTPRLIFENRQHVLPNVKFLTIFQKIKFLKL